MESLCTDRVAVLLQVAGWDFKRVLTSRGANLLATLLLNPSVSDLTGSYRLYKREVLKDLILSVKGRAYVFQMEVSLSPAPLIVFARQPKITSYIVCTR